MKLIKNITTGLYLAVQAEKYCDVNELMLPDNAERWNCMKVHDAGIPAGTICYLQCNPGYVATKCKYLFITSCHCV